MPLPGIAPCVPFCSADPTAGGCVPPLESPALATFANSSVRLPSIRNNSPYTFPMARRLPSLQGDTDVSHRIPALAFVAALVLTNSLLADDKVSSSRKLLPNGWAISPAGRQVPLTDLPLNILPLADGKR